MEKKRNWIPDQVRDDGVWASPEWRCASKSGMTMLLSSGWQLIVRRPGPDPGSIYVIRTSPRAH